MHPPHDGVYPTESGHHERIAPSIPHEPNSVAALLSQTEHLSQFATRAQILKHSLANSMLQRALLAKNSIYRLGAL